MAAWLMLWAGVLLGVLGGAGLMVLCAAWLMKPPRQRNSRNG